MFSFGEDKFKHDENIDRERASFTKNLKLNIKIIKS